MRDPGVLTGRLEGEIMETSRPEGSRRNYLADLREAIAGTEQDFTEGSLGRAILLLSVPMVLEMAMESVFAVVDIFFVSRLGSDSVAAVGLTESILTLVFAVSGGLSAATTAMVARRIGEKKPERAALAAAQSTLISVAVSLPVSLIGILAAPLLLETMGASPETVSAGAGYCAVMIGGNLVIVLLFILNAVFRGAGDASIAMRVLWFANGVNLVLDPCLIFGLGPFPELGVTGAAVATTTGRGLAVAYQIFLLFRGNGRIRVRPEHFLPDPGILKRLIRLSLGGVFQYTIATSSWIILFRIVAEFGSTALAGYTVALRILIFAMLPAWGMGNAAATLVGQNLGAQKPDRAERAVWRSGFYSMLFLGMVALLFIFFAEPLVKFFIRDPSVVPVGVDCLRYLSCGNLCYAYGMVIAQAFNGAGDTYTPTWINLFCYWLFQIPLSYLLAIPFGMGPQGVFTAILISESAVAITGIVIFRRGRWKERMV
jgi:putative MATE family efflux protein